MSASRTFPLDFRLSDENDHYILYITDDPQEEHRIRMELRNSSKQTLYLPQLEGEPSQDNCHFELQFRRGILSENTLKLLDSPDSPVLSAEDRQAWKIGLIQPAGVDYVSLCFLSTQERKLPDTGGIELFLNHISADGSGGARGTRVIMVPQEIRYEADQVLVRSIREQNLYLTNHSGLKRIPLHVGFKGSNRVLCSAPGGDLKIQAPDLDIELRNIARLNQPAAFSTLRFRKQSVLDGVDVAATRITISFDFGTEQEKPWALGTADDLSMAEVNVIRPKKAGDGSNKAQEAQEAQEEQEEEEEQEAPDGRWQRTPDARQEKGIKGFEFEPTEDILLERGQSLIFRLSEIYSSLPPGPTNVFFHYQNVPGYWDGYFVLQIMKTQLMFVGDDIGIGTNQPRGRLDVNGPIFSEGLEIGEQAEDGSQWSRTVLSAGGEHLDQPFLMFQANRGGGDVEYIALHDATELAEGQSSIAWKYGPNGDTYARLAANISGVGSDDGQMTLYLLHDGVLRPAMIFRAKGGVHFKANSIQTDNDVNASNVYAGFVSSDSLRVGDPDVTASAEGLPLLRFRTNSGGQDVEFISMHDFAENNAKESSIVWKNGPNKEIFAKLAAAKQGDEGQVILYLVHDGVLRPGMVFNAKDGVDFKENSIHTGSSVYADILGSRSLSVTQLYINGKEFHFSDKRMKKDILSIKDALAKVTALTGITFHWNEKGLQHLTRGLEQRLSAGPGASEEQHRSLRQAEKARQMAELDGLNYGLIAQEVEAVAPEIVSTDDEGMKHIQYSRMIPLLVEAIKEQNALIEGLHARVAALEAG